MSEESMRKTLIAFTPIYVGAVALLVSFLRLQYSDIRVVVGYLENPAFALISGAATVILFLLIIPSVLGLPVRRLGYVTALIQGSDNRPSTSKVQFFWWSIAVFFAYGALKVRQLQMGMGDPLSVPPLLLVAIGASVITAGAAKGLAARQAGKNERAPSAAPSSDNEPTDPKPGDGAGVTSSNTPAAVVAMSGQNVAKPLPPAGDVSYTVTADSGEVDLTKIQLLSWTIIAIALFLWQVGKLLFGGKQFTELPEIDSALVVLSGVAQGAYLGHKLVPDNTPWLLSLAPQSKAATEIDGDLGLEVTIKGMNFGNQQDGSMIALNGSPVAIKVNSWSENEIKFVLPQGLTPNTAVYVGVVVGGQSSANALPFAVT